MWGRQFWWMLFLAGCGSSGSVPNAWDNVPSARRIAALCCDGRDPAGVRIEHGKLIANGKVLTPEFRAVDSFDVSLERREVVFSAKREDNFDIGLVSLDGSDIHWLPEERADEVAVQWAPRGHKVSYVIRGAGGDLVRTVHIPTATQLVADFPYAVVRSLAWDAAAERYSVVLTSPDASDRVESLKYDGRGRKSVTPAAVHLDVAIEPFAGGILMRPSLLRYNERLPLVVWISDEPLEWNDARGALMKQSRVAMAVVKEMPDPLIDASRVFVVDPLTRVVASSQLAPPAESRPSHITYIVPSDLPAGRYRIRGNVIEVPRAIVESFASGWIAKQLKESNDRR